MFQQGPYLLAGAVYGALALASLHLASLTSGVAAIWPAAGFGYAMARIHGLAVTPYLLLGGFLAALRANAPELAGLLAASDVFAIALAAVLTGRRNAFGPAAEPAAFFQSPERMAAFMVLSALTLGVTAATAGVAALTLHDALPPGMSWTVWGVWALSDMTGVLMLSPMLLAWSAPLSQKRPATFAKRVETALVFTILIMLGHLIFWQTQSLHISQYPLAFTFSPLLIWVAFRLGRRALSTAIFLSAAMAVTGALAGYGPFASLPFPLSLQLLQTYMLVMGGTALMLHTVVRERANGIQALSRAQDAAVQGLASLAETRDLETGSHIMRTQHYVRTLADALKDHPAYKDDLTPHLRSLIFKSAPLHDIGKVGVPDAILLKPGKLTREEFESIKHHTTYGRDALRAARQRLGEASFIDMAEAIAYTHHERWDGSGYPQGLVGQNIPLAGRLMALADVYDALTSDRVYKRACSHLEAKAIILRGKGSHFDPDVVDAFIRTEHEFYRISRRYKDSGAVSRDKAATKPDVPQRMLSPHCARALANADVTPPPAAAATIPGEPRPRPS